MVSKLGVSLATWVFHFLHAVLLVLCIWVALDRQFSPRHYQTNMMVYGILLLPFYYLGALSIGLLTHMVPRARLHEETAKIAAELAAKPQPALRAAKEAMIAGADLPLEQALRTETMIAERLTRESNSEQ